MKRYIRSSSIDKKYYKVTFGWDEGGPESGPIFKSDYVVLKARNKQDAENRVMNKMSGLDGCYAELATQEDIDQFVSVVREAEDEYQYLVDHGLIDPDLDAEMAEAMDPNRFKKMTVSELRKYYHDYVEYEGFDSFADWYNFLKSQGSR